MHITTDQTLQITMMNTSTPKNTDSMNVDPEHIDDYIAYLTGEFEKREETYKSIYAAFRSGCDKMNADDVNGIAELAELAALFFENEEENARLLKEEDGTDQLVFENFLLFAAINNISVAMDKDRPPSNIECDAMLQVGSEIMDSGMPKHLVPRYLSSEYVGTFTGQVNCASEATHEPIFANHGMIPIVVNH